MSLALDSDKNYKFVSSVVCVLQYTTHVLLVCVLMKVTLYDKTLIFYSFKNIFMLWYSALRGTNEPFKVVRNINTQILFQTLSALPSTFAQLGFTCTFSNAKQSQENSLYHDHGIENSPWRFTHILCFFNHFLKTGEMAKQKLKILADSAKCF